MANLFKKVILLGFIFLAIVAVYLIKNGDVRESVLLKLGLASFNDFKIPGDIQISKDDISMDNLSSVIGDQDQDTESDFSEELYNAGEAAQKDIVPAVVLVETGEKITLDEVGAQVEQISKQVETIAKEIDILIAMNEIQKKINTLAEQAKDLNLDCAECNILSSI